MLPNGLDPPLKMLTTVQKVRETERLLQDLTECEQSLEIPGNFRALQRRRKHDQSRRVFPERKGKRNEDFDTHYTLNFKANTNRQASKERPCSPTRRNNPHPSKNFLTWRIPTRVFDYGKAKKANVSFLNSNINDTFQSFYDDYSGKKNNASEVDTKLLLEMTKTYSGAAKKKHKNKRGKIELISGDPSTHAISLPGLLRKSWSPNQASFGLPKRKSDALSPLFVSEELQPLFQSWYDAASAKTTEKDKEAPMKANNVLAEIEESYLKKALENALQPDAIEAIEDWLLEADDEERAIAMQFIQTILLVSMQKQKKTTIETQTRIWSPTDKKCISPSTAVKPKEKHHHHHSKSCDVCTRKNLEGALQHLQTVAAQKHELPGITELLNPLHPGVLAQNEKRKKFVNNRRKLNRPQNVPPTFKPGNKGSLFVASQKPKGRHFTIHPEWY